MQALRIDSNWDVHTAACAAFRMKYLIDELFSEIDFISRFGPMAARDEIEDLLIANPMPYITGMGHGAPTIFSGDGGDAIWKVDKYNPNEVKNKIIHLMSCLTAKVLGKDMVLNGCKAFFGYSDVFKFTRKKPPPDSPLDDEYISIFVDIACEVDRCLLKGFNAEQTHNIVLNRYNLAVEEWALKFGDVASRLYSNSNCFRSPSMGKAWGDKKAKLPIQQSEPFTQIIPETYTLVNASEQEWSRNVAINESGQLVPLSDIWAEGHAHKIKPLSKCSPDELRELVASRAESIPVDMAPGFLGASIDPQKIRSGESESHTYMEMELSFLGRIITPILDNEYRPALMKSTELDRPVALDLDHKPITLRNYKQAYEEGLSLGHLDLDDSNRKKLTLARYEYFPDWMVEVHVGENGAYSMNKEDLIKNIINDTIYGEKLIKSEMLMTGRLAQLIELGRLRI